MTVTKYPAKQHWAKVARILGLSEGLVYLKSDTLKERHDTDVELVFRQESNFYYLTGYNEHGAHVVYDIKTHHLTLLPHQQSEHEVVWAGRDPSASELLNISLLKEAIVEARIHKSAFEIERMRKINLLSSNAHVVLMKAAKECESETELDALFRYETGRRGAKIQAYNPIVGVGSNAATLYYGRNSTSFNQDLGQLILVDAGAEQDCYASDITRTYPLNGKFTPDMRTLYEIVLEMQMAVLEALKPGVEWEAMHRLAAKIAVRGLQQAGVLRSEFSVETMLEHHVDGIFFPHGLGHMIGLDVHDVGGYPKGVERIQAPGLRYLRMRRKMEAGFVVTVEPGVYFTEYILEEAKQDETLSRFVDWEVLDRFQRLGGVRIEDCVVITETGIDNLTTVPKTISEIEEIMG
ncbi:Xaa-Pro dipeptidase [Entomortierella parvispora]|uniref:Xaa-Pro dipeptidase n=1 Tax=Entomortierella parvispora TaxID=205924 RepID=A0A9P3H2P2_9FUNG|nr:Xaa-Pro dipeptidase [Entomortierella parvispora]